MKTYWGDLHNHCGITYGYGSQANALRRAADHLDFCAVTGHAMWPDIMERNPETAFTIDFHKVGFKKLRDHWEEVRAEVAAANSDKLVTFQAYEMHSSLYGDHHIVSPSDDLPLVYRDSPAALREAAGVPALTVGHHIGYTPGYRGINWDLYDETVTPLIEVCSKHGCSMSETAPFAYYHNMGPRDSHNTVYEGLRRGYHFGFVGSTDHHAGYPGSYGDGKLAALAEEKNRAALWDAFLKRHTYAVTGDRIACSFHVNDGMMGDILPLTARRKIEWFVSGGYDIDKIVLYKNLRPIQVVNGEMLRAMPHDNRFKLRVEMGWGNNAEEAFRWDGALRVKGGQIRSAEPCFRGRSVLAPSTTDTTGFDDVNDLDNRILSLDDSACTWQCFTLKNVSTLHPSTCAVIVEIEGDKDTQVTITVNGHEKTATLSELCAYGYSEHMKPWHSNAYKVHRAIPCARYETGCVFEDDDSAPAFYHLEVAQKNGHWAFVTPVWVGETGPLPVED